MVYKCYLACMKEKEKLSMNMWVIVDESCSMSHTWLKGVVVETQLYFRQLIPEKLYLAADSPKTCISELSLLNHVWTLNSSKTCYFAVNSPKNYVRQPIPRKPVFQSWVLWITFLKNSDWINSDCSSSDWTKNKNSDRLKFRSVKFRLVKFRLAKNSKFGLAGIQIG